MHLLIAFLAIFLLPQTTLEKEIPRPTPLPDILEFVDEDANSARFTDVEKETIQTLKAEYKSAIDSSLATIREQDLKLRDLSKQNAPLNEIEAFNKLVIKERIHLSTLKLNFRDDLIGIIGDATWNSIAQQYDEVHPYELGIVVERISPIPNYMIVVYYIEGLELTDDQKQEIDHWNEEGHYKAMLMLSAMAEKEQEIRTLALENAPKADVIKAVKALEMMRHKLLITKTDCRDYIKDKVLTAGQWDLMIAEMDQ